MLSRDEVVLKEKETNRVIKVQNSLLPLFVKADGGVCKMRIADGLSRVSTAAGKRAGKTG